MAQAQPPQQSHQCLTWASEETTGNLQHMRHRVIWLWDSSECVTFWLAERQNTAIAGVFWVHHCLEAAKHCQALLPMEVTSYNSINEFYIYPQLLLMSSNIGVRNEKDWNSIISVRFHVMLFILVTFPLVSSCSRTVTPSSVYWLPRNSPFSLFPKQKLPAATRGSQPGARRRRSHPRCFPPGAALPSPRSERGSAPLPRQGGRAETERGICC